jgi:2,5-furandicarboxylate decarboxylase 1
MNFREFVAAIRCAGQLSVVEREVDRYLEAAALIHALGERPALLRHVRDSEYPVVAGTCSSRALMALGLDTRRSDLMPALARAMRNPVAPGLVEEAACQQVLEQHVHLNALPILTHLAIDGGPYVSAAIAIVQDPELGRNMSFHRLMLLDDRHFAVRLVENRGTHAALARAGGELEIAFCIGSSPAVLLAAAMSPPPGVDELAIANALAPTPVVMARSVGLQVPADSEIVLEGRILAQTVEEGPFLDLTETMDIVRKQHVVEIFRITHRREAMYQALLPGGLEHKLLMGMPREPTMFDAVSAVCDCVNVALTPGGGSWLHGVVQIRKRRVDDGRLAIEAAFRGHPSLKHVLVVDDDIDIDDPVELEWAMATRLQADRGVVVLPGQGGSSLDPSALHVPGAKSRTAKMGLDATIPWLKPDGSLRSEQERAAFRKVRYAEVPLDQYVKDREDHT